MKRLSLFAYAASVVIITAISLQAQMGPPTPAPETKKLELLAGDWTAQGTMTAGPPGTPESKWTMNTHAEWMQGNFFLVEHSDLDMAGMGKGTEVAFLGYDSDKKVYTYHAFNSWGEAESATGTIEGDTWTWTSDEHMGGRTMKGRYTMKVQSPSSYTMKFELSPDGNQWNTGMEGKATKK